MTKATFLVNELAEIRKDTSINLTKQEAMMADASEKTEEEITDLQLALTEIFELGGVL